MPVKKTQLKEMFISHSEKLIELHQTLLSLYLEDNLSQKRISELLKMKPQAIKHKLSRAIFELKKASGKFKYLDELEEKYRSMK